MALYRVISCGKLSVFKLYKRFWHANRCRKLVDWRQKPARDAHETQLHPLKWIALLREYRSFVFKRLVQVIVAFDEFFGGLPNTLRECRVIRTCLYARAGCRLWRLLFPVHLFILSLTAYRRSFLPTIQRRSKSDCLSHDAVLVAGGDGADDWAALVQYDYLSRCGGVKVDIIANITSLIDRSPGWVRSK